MTKDPAKYTGAYLDYDGRIKFKSLPARNDVADDGKFVVGTIDADNRIKLWLKPTHTPDP